MGPEQKDRPELDHGGDGDAEPPATADEVEPAARQFVGKISGVGQPSATTALGPGR